MKRTTILILMASWMPFAASAQPPEEVPPPPPDATIEIPASHPSAPAPVPVAEPKPVAPISKEDNTMRGVTLTPKVGVYPIGFDNLNIGTPGDPEGSRYFMALKPGVDFSTSFKTSTGKVINLSVEYALMWREYFNKAATKRDFENDVDASIKVPWTDLVSTSLSASFAHFYKAGTDTNDDNALLLDLNPLMGFKVNDQFNIKAGYWMRFIDLFDAKYNPDPPSDIDDIRAGLSSSSSTFGAYDYFGNFSYFANAPSAPVTVPGTQYQSFHAAQVGAGFTPIKGTTIGLNYRYVFAAVSNVPDAEWLGHIIMPKFSQALPWTGGSASLGAELRLQEFKNKTIDGGAAKNGLRTRFTFSIEQAITENISWEGFYRLQFSGSNADNYGNIKFNHWLYTGVTFSF